MAKKNAAKQTVTRFSSNAYYVDGAGYLYVCTNARRKKAEDGNPLVTMQKIVDGQPSGADEECDAETFVRQLTKAEVAEWLQVEQREAEAIAAATVTSEPAAPKPRPKQTKASDGGNKKLSALDAAAQVLTEAEGPLNAKQMIEQMAARKYWTSPGGKTPHSTLYAAILREINTKGHDSRFRKTDRGQFTRNA